MCLFRAFFCLGTNVLQILSWLSSDIEEISSCLSYNKRSCSSSAISSVWVFGPLILWVIGFCFLFGFTSPPSDASQKNWDRETGFQSFAVIFLYFNYYGIIISRRVQNLVYFWHMMYRWKWFITSSSRFQFAYFVIFVSTVYFICSCGTCFLLKPLTVIYYQAWCLHLSKILF